MTPHAEAVDNLQFFVALFYDGSLSRNFELEELIWQVKLAANAAIRHEPLHFQEQPASTKLLTELSLADLGL